MSLAADAADALEREVRKLEEQVAKLEALTRPNDQEVSLTIFSREGGAEFGRTLAVVTLREGLPARGLEITLERPTRVHKILMEITAVKRVD